MNKYLKNLAMIMTIIAGVAAIIGLYSQYKDDNPTIEIKSITIDKLTDLPKVDGLNAQYYYKDSLVHSLWKLNYQISNVGNKTIVGEGNNKNIIKEKLTFNFSESFKILEVNPSHDTLPLKLAFNQNIIEIKFLQWKTREALNFTIYVEQLSDKGTPLLKTDEREIINGKVIYSSLQNEIVQKKSLFDSLPRIIQSILLWIGYIFF